MRRYLPALLILCGLFAAGPAAAHPPYGLAADRSGNVYFSDLERVWRLSPDGRLSVFRPHVPETHVHALTVAPDGAIVGDQNRYDPATERFYSGLWRRTAAGAEQPLVAMSERPPPGSGVWQDSEGNRYTSQWLSTADRRMVLLRRRLNGRVDVLFDEAGAAPRLQQTTVESIGGMAFDRKGFLFFANGGALRRLAPDGTVAQLYDGGPKSNLRGLAATGDGLVLAADMGEKTVLAVAPDGKVSTLYRETAAWSPTAVALADGRLLVLEANDDHREYDNRVRLIEVKDGRGRVVALPAGSMPMQAAESTGDQESRSKALMLLVCLTAPSTFYAAWQSLRRARSAKHL